MDGLLVVDKPAGPTSHDVVERARRALGERRIGHTGTLDPGATGVLCLVLGRATRLAQFLSSSDKTYEAVVRFGFGTDTGDAAGRPTADASAGPPPARAAIDHALDAFRGTFLQQPPAFSAKKIAGTRSHRLARARARGVAVADEDRRPEPGILRDDATNSQFAADLPRAVTVTAHRIDIVAAEGDSVTLIVTCSSGFYVRSLAHDLGQRLGTGAHLTALRRTRCGGFAVEQALSLDEIESNPARAAAAVVPLVDVLPDLPVFQLSDVGVRRAVNGCELGRSDGVAISAGAAGQPLYRLLDRSGSLVGVARATNRPGVLHPAVILM